MRGCGVGVSGFEFWVFGFRVSDFGLELEFRVWGSGFRVQGWTWAPMMNVK